MSDTKICPACSEENIGTAHFCVSCGTNLQLHEMKGKQASIEKFEASLDGKKLNTIQQLMNTIDELSPYEHEFEQQVQYEKALEDQLRNLQNKIDKLRMELKQEQADVDELESFTLTSLIARIKGDKEERLSKEIEERVFAQEKLDATIEERDQVEKELQTVRKERKEIEVLSEQLQSSQVELKSLLASIFEGTNHPEEDKLENQRDVLKDEVSKLTTQFHRIQNAKNQMQGAHRSLGMAHDKLSSAGNYADWDSIFGGGIIVDSMKHNRWQDARRHMRTANSQIQRARSIYPGINTEFVDANRQGSDVFDVWFDNVFSDFRARSEIKRSRDQVSRVMYQVSDVINDLSSRISSYEREMNQKQQELNQVKEDLNNKRIQLVEEILAKKN